MSTVAARIMTAEEFLALPNAAVRRELHQGEVREMAPTGHDHGVYEMALGALLHFHVKANKLGLVTPGDAGFIVSRNPDTVLCPDVAFLSQERIDHHGRTGRFWPGAPDLAVEVISPNDTAFEVEEKVQQWLAAGTRLVWVVNPKSQTVTVHAADGTKSILTASDHLAGGDVVPGFCLRIAEIFE